MVHAYDALAAHRTFLVSNRLATPAADASVPARDEGVGLLVIQADDAQGLVGIGLLCIGFFG